MLVVLRCALQPFGVWTAKDEASRTSKEEDERNFGFCLEAVDNTESSIACPSAAPLTRPPASWLHGFFEPIPDGWCYERGRFKQFWFNWKGELLVVTSETNLWLSFLLFSLSSILLTLRNVGRSYEYIYTHTHSPVLFFRNSSSLLKSLPIKRIRRSVHYSHGSIIYLIDQFLQRTAFIVCFVIGIKTVAHRMISMKRKWCSEEWQFRWDSWSNVSGVLDANICNEPVFLFSTFIIFVFVCKFNWGLCMTILRNNFTFWGLPTFFLLN